MNRAPHSQIVEDGLKLADGVVAGRIQPLGCERLLAEALIELSKRHSGPEETVAALLRDLRHEIGENMGYAASATILERIDAALKNAAPQGSEEIETTASRVAPARAASEQPEAGADAAPQRYSIILANGIVTWVTTTDGEWVRWDEVSQSYATDSGSG